MGTIKTKTQELLNDIKTEILASFDKEEIKSFKNFEEFFAEVDTLNAYEEEWRPAYYKQFYETVYEQLIRELKFEGMRKNKIEDLNKQLLRLILAINANANAYDDDLADTWKTLLKEWRITQSQLENYITEEG